MKRLLLSLGAAAMLLAGLSSPVSAHNDKAAVRHFEDGSEVGQGSHTRLNRHKVEANAHLRNLTPGDAITVWAVVFESPDECVDGCGGDDVDAAFAAADDPDLTDLVDITLTYAAGGVVNPGGNLNLRNGIGGGQILVGDGEVNNPHSAEIHFVIRSHGPHQPGTGDTTSVGGGCDTQVCSDIQFSVHLP